MEKVQRRWIYSLVGHVFQSMFDSLIQEEKVSRCNGRAIQLPRKNNLTWW